MTKKTYKIKGMHCNSCATLIEKELQSIVNSVSASYSKEEAVIDYDESKISEDEIKKRVEKLGYECSCEYCPTINDSKKTNNKEKSSKIGWFILAGGVILLIIIIYLSFGNNIKLPEIALPQMGEKTSLILLFVAGLLVGFHCISMCGAFVLSYTTKNAQNGHKGYKQHLVYGGSKVISYAIIGGVFGIIGGLIAFSTGLRGAVAIFAGGFMIFYALSMFGIKFFKKFQMNPKFLTKAATKAQSKAKGPYKGPFITGLLNGLFIACGPLQAMYLYAAGTGSFFSGATSLAVFGLGTIPVMIGFGSLATVISHKTTRTILKFSAIIVLILGLIMLNRGLTVIGSPYSYDGIKAKLIPQNSGANSTLTDGIQVINMDMDTKGYHPNSFVTKKGVPVKWNINVTELIPCNNEIILSGYNIDEKLKSGMNIIEFTPDKDGTFQFTCGMGMLHGNFIVTESGTASQEQVKAKPPSSGATCSMGTNSTSCGCGM
jgi:uncharacterized protein